MDKFNDWVIQPNDWRINLKDAIDLILDFDETIQLDLIWMQFHWKYKIKKWVSKF